MSSNWEGISVIIFDFEGTGGNMFGCHFSTSNSIKEFKLLISESNISLIEVISDSSPPIFILCLFDEFSDKIILFLFCYLLKVLIITEMFELVVPSVWNTSYFDLSLLIFLI